MSVRTSSHTCSIVLVILLALAGGLGNVAFAGPATGANVSGHAYLEDQTDHSGIKVLFVAQPGTGQTDSTYTDALGGYALDLSVGVYFVRYTKDGYIPAELPGEQYVATDAVLPDVSLEAGQVREISGSLSGILTPEFVYFVVGDLTVEPGDTLLIQPGVEIRFRGPFGMTVTDGCLLAQGAVDDSIRLVSGRSAPAPGDWRGVRIQSTQDNLLSYVVIKDAVISLESYNIPCRVRIENSHLASASSESIYLDNCYNGNVRVNSTLTDNRLTARYGGTLDLEDSIIRSSPDEGISVNTWSIDTLRINRCEITTAVSEGNSSVVLVTNNTASSQLMFSGSSCECRGNCVIGVNSGIYIASRMFAIHNNVIIDSNSGIQVEHGDLPPAGSITGNTFVGGSRAFGVRDDPPPFIGFNCFHDVAVLNGGPIAIPGLGAPVTTNANGDSCDVYYNILLDPQMVDPANGDYHLQAGSPCIDAGDPAQPLDPDGTVGDMGAFYFHQGAPAAPHADFAADPVSGMVPLGVEFSGLCTGPITSYLWNFGDGRTSASVQPVHTYTEAGLYTVTLTVIGPGGQDAEAKVDYIAVAPATWPPQCEFTGTPRTGYPPLAVNFTSSVVGTVDSYAWDFGDGTPPATDPDPMHLYQEAGTYDVCLTVTGPYGQDTECKAGYVTVHEPGEVVAAFTVSDSLGVAPMTVSFADQSLGVIDSRHWWFGDGGESEGQNPVHTYLATGTYYPRLAVGGPGGADTLTAPTPIRVYPAAPAVQEIADVPDDQGGRVWVRWYPSGLDGTVANGVVGYSVWQRGSAGEWFEVGSTLARQQAAYSLLAMTLADSTVDRGIHWSVFRVTAHTTDPGVFYSSEPDSGYSVDNLAPSIPGLLRGVFDADVVRLVWDPVPDRDLRYYEVHRGSAPDFVPVPQTRRGRAIDASYTDSDWESGATYYYKVLACDFAGNAGDASNASNPVTTGVGSGAVRPARFMLAAASPNPARAATRFDLSLPEASQVKVTVFEANGTEVRTLGSGAMAPGIHPLWWDCRDDAGHPVPSGAYFVRMSAQGQSGAAFETTRKVVRVQ